MKVLTIVLLIAMASVLALPAQENSGKTNTLGDFVSESDGEYVHELVRDKRGNKLYDIDRRC